MSGVSYRFKTNAINYLNIFLFKISDFIESLKMNPKNGGGKESKL